MSISRFQETLFGSRGCGSVILIGCAAVFLGFAFQQWGKGGGLEKTEGQQRVAGTVAGIPIYAEDLEKGVSAATAQASAMGGPQVSTPMQDLQATSSALNQYVNQTAILALATKAGISFSDQQLHQALDEGFQQIRSQMEMFGQVKKGASEQDFQDAFKKQTGKTIDEAKALEFKKAKDGLADKTQKSAVMGRFAQQILLDQVKAGIHPTEQQVRDSYNTDNIKQILIKGSADAQQQAEKVLAEIKGGLDFDKAIDRYSNDAPLGSKKLSESALRPVAAAEIATDERYKALQGLKAGDVSAVVNSPEGKLIYKVVSIKSNLPADFDKNKSKYISQYALQQAGSQLQQQITALLKSSVKWESPGFKAVWDFTQLQSNFGPDREKQVQAVLDEAKAAVAKNLGYDQRAAAFAYYGAFDMVYNSPTADKIKLRDQRIEVLNAVLQATESIDLRLELAELYAQEKNADGVAQTLTQAASDINSFEDAGVRQNRDIGAAAEKYKAAGLLTDKAFQQIEATQTRWQKDKAEYDADQATQKQQQEQARKEAQATEAAARAEAKKQAAQSKNSTSAPAAPSSGSAFSPTVPSTPGTPAPGTTGTPGGK